MKQLLFTLTLSIFILISCDKDDDIIEKSGKVTDIDGNEYKTIAIDKQLWMAENLSVTKYRNGDPIITGIVDSGWANTDKKGAFAIYPHEKIDGLDSEEEVLDAYGGLYNWYAVADERGLCPEGWRMPDDEDWIQLINYLEGEAKDAGGKLKSTRTEPDSHPRWNSPNTGATDKTGFKAFPGGVQSNNGLFVHIGNRGYWWSSSNHGINNTAWLLHLNNNNNNAVINATNNEAGLSVRCLKD